MKPYAPLATVAASAAALVALMLLNSSLLGPPLSRATNLVAATAVGAGVPLVLAWLLSRGVSPGQPARIRRLGSALAGGIWILALTWIRPGLAGLAASLELRTALLLLESAILFIPAFLLGMALMLSTRTLTEIPTADSPLIANTRRFVPAFLAGAVIGFVVAMLLRFSDPRMLPLALGTLPIAGAVLESLISGARRLALALSAGFTALATLGLALGPATNSRTTPALLARDASEHGDLRVFNAVDGRELLQDGVILAVVDTTTWESSLPPTAVLGIPHYLFTKAGRLLLVGLKSGWLAKYYTRNGWSVDVVEPNPATRSFAQKFFGLSPSDGKIMTEDLAAFFRSSTDRYTLILLDAYPGSSVPLQATTEEGLRNLKAHLADNGMLGICIGSTEWNALPVRSVARTLQQFLPNVIALPVAEPPNTPGPIVLVASKDSLQIRRGLERDYHDIFYRFSASYYKNHAWDNRFAPDTAGAILLTDRSETGRRWERDREAAEWNRMTTQARHEALAW